MARNIEIKACWSDAESQERIAAGLARIHLDEVEGLGWFIELEIVLRPDQSETEGRTITDRLMSELGVEPSDLVAGAYVDLLANKEPQNSVEPTA